MLIFGNDAKFAHDYQAHGFLPRRSSRLSKETGTNRGSPRDKDSEKSTECSIARSSAPRQL